MFAGNGSAPIEQPSIPQNDATLLDLKFRSGARVAFRPSFDCAKASTTPNVSFAPTASWRVGCENVDLYRRGLSSVTDTNVFLGEQQVWLSERDDCTESNAWSSRTMIASRARALVGR